MQEGAELGIVVPAVEVNQAGDRIVRPPSEKIGRQSLGGLRKESPEGIAGEGLGELAARRREGDGAMERVFVEVEASGPSLPFYTDLLEAIKVAAQQFGAPDAIAVHFEQGLTDPATLVLQEVRSAAVDLLGDAPAVAVIGPGHLMVSVVETAQPAFEVPAIVQGPIGGRAAREIAVGIVRERLVSGAGQTAKVVVGVIRDRGVAVPSFGDTRAPARRVVFIGDRSAVGKSDGGDLSSSAIGEARDLLSGSRLASFRDRPSLIIELPGEAELKLAGNVAVSDFREPAGPVVAVAGDEPIGEGPLGQPAGVRVVAIGGWCRRSLRTERSWPASLYP